MDAADDGSTLAAARARMVREQLRDRGITSPTVLAAMGRVPRELFVPPELIDEAYADRALGIGCDQTISQPLMVALMTQALGLSGDEHVLEVGTGSGYQVAVLAELAGDVVSIERHEDLSRRAGDLLERCGYRNVQLVVGDGTLGWPSAAPFDRIIVTAATPNCPPALWDQLVDGGVLVAPIGPTDVQTLQSIRKVGGRPMIEQLTSCRFVPLIGRQPPD